LQIKPLSGSSDWPIWKGRIRDFLDYHNGTLSVDGTLVKPELLAGESTDAQRRQFNHLTTTGAGFIQCSKKIIIPKAPDISGNFSLLQG